jgi:ACT domain-containing protein
MNYYKKRDEIEPVENFLKDQRYVIELKSRASGKKTKIPIVGV